MKRARAGELLEDALSNYMFVALIFGRLPFWPYSPKAIGP